MVGCIASELSYICCCRGVPQEQFQYAWHSRDDSDNTMCFACGNSKEFMTKTGITHVTSEPHHPARNGLAERDIQTLKELMEKECRRLDGDTSE